MLGKRTTTIVPYQEKVARKKRNRKTNRNHGKRMRTKTFNRSKKTTNLNIRLVDKKQILTSSLI